MFLKGASFQGLPLCVLFLISEDLFATFWEWRSSGRATRLNGGGAKEGLSAHANSIVKVRELWKLSSRALVKFFTEIVILKPEKENDKKTPTLFFRRFLQWRIHVSFEEVHFHFKCYRDLQIFGSILQDSWAGYFRDGAYLSELWVTPNTFADLSRDPLLFCLRVTVRMISADFAILTATSQDASCQFYVLQRTDIKMDGVSLEF